MRMTLRMAGSLFVPAVLLAGPAFAQYANGQEQAVVAVHAQAHDAKGLGCDVLNPDLPCGEFVTTWPVGEAADVFFVVARADSALGISGASLGVDYGNTPGARADGVGCDVLGYVSCADLEYTVGIDLYDLSTEFPAAGGGARLIWIRQTNCQRHVVGTWGVQVPLCAFYVYAYSLDRFEVGMNIYLQTGPELQVVDCSVALSDLPFPSHAGYVDFGFGTGYNPCLALGPVPTERTSWGRLKSQYE